MNKAVLLLLSVFSFLCSCKKDLLHWQNVQKINTNTLSSLYNIHFVNDSICVVGGGTVWAKSDILRSNDGGYTFTLPNYSDVGIGMMGLCLSQNGNVYMCGANGSILFSNDNGKNWLAGNINAYLFNVGISFPSPNTGILISTHLQEGGSITTVDSNFRIVNKQDFLFGLNRIYMADANTGYVVGYGALLKTTDGGVTWNLKKVSGDNFTGISVIGNEIWICGFNGCIYHSYDLGNNWERLRNGNDVTVPYYNMQDIVFKDKEDGWAVCDNGKIIHTDDGGKHWAEYDQLTGNALRSITICPNGDILVAGDNGSLYRVHSN